MTQAVKNNGPSSLPGQAYLSTLYYHDEMTSAATKHRLQVLSPRAARHHSIASSHIPACPTSIKPLARCFPHKRRTLPSTVGRFRGTLSPVREQRLWWRSVQENIMNLLLNFMFNSFCIYYFAGKDHLFTCTDKCSGKSLFSPCINMLLEAGKIHHPPRFLLFILHTWNHVMMNVHSSQTWTESDGVSGQWIHTHTHTPPTTN